jgi:hypothetical protein
MSQLDRTVCHGLSLLVVWRDPLMGLRQHSLSIGTGDNARPLPRSQITAGLSRSVCFRWTAYLGCSGTGKVVAGIRLGRARMRIAYEAQQFKVTFARKVGRVTAHFHQRK